MAERTKHERILLKRKARVFVGDGETPDFEMFCSSRDLSISGMFLNTDCLLRVGREINVDLEVREGEWLPLVGAVARRIEFNDREHAPGFAVTFGQLSATSRETLLRYFVTARIVEFTKIFRAEFPHLDERVTEQDLALVVNLWEDHRHALVEDGREAPIRPPPKIFEVPAARSAREPEASRKRR